jgi:predicted Ser/Thr protein kinase
MIGVIFALGFEAKKFKNPKNIVENDNGRLFLIDFEVVSIENKERDPEWILRDKP